MANLAVDFQDVKQVATPDHVMRYLAITLRQHGDTWRGPCPLCKDRDQRAFLITTSKRLFHCFKCKVGGDMLKLVAEAKHIPTRDAALELAKFCGLELVTSGTGRTSAPVPGNSSPSPDRKGFDAEKYAAGLDPANQALEPLGISEQTLRQWKAGYSPAGVLRGKLALPIASKDGTIIGYVGRTLKDETPTLLFPNGLSPSEYIFGADRVMEGELYLVRDPLDVLRAAESGVDNAVCFLCEITPQMLEMLSSLMDEKHCQTITLF
jgi:DNA primase